jgi:hypothetical protein
MCEIIDFQSRKTALLLHKARKCAEDLGRQAARAEWLKRNGAPLADLVRASLDFDQANRDCREIRQSLSGPDEEAPNNLHS